jgi:uncharacterized membrane protein
MKFSITDEREVKKFFIIFYVVGIIGMAIPYTLPLFKILTPFALILSFGYLVFFHPTKKDSTSNALFFFIFLAGLVVEIIGVKTGIIFGGYEYGNSLGIKVFETPLLIGINWLFLVYTTACIVDKTNWHAIVKIVVAASGMLVYDIVLEQVAPKMDMWSWQDNVVPIQNYIAWFVIAAFFHSLLKIFKVKLSNPLAAHIIACQFVFFVVLLFLL